MTRRPRPPFLIPAGTRSFELGPRAAVAQRVEADPKSFGRFKAILREDKPDLPADARIAIRGSAVTGDGFLERLNGYFKDYFDIERKSDWGVAIVSPTLTLKINEFQKEMREGVVEPALPDSGAHLIRDYLAGRLIPENDTALAGVLARVRDEFVVVDEKDFMKAPKQSTGYTGFHVQFRHENGMTIELQVTPPPFKKAGDEQREIFEKYRDFGNEIPNELWPEYQRDLARSRQIFERAWKEWLTGSNNDPRVQ